MTQTLTTTTAEEVTADKLNLTTLLSVGMLCPTESLDLSRSYLVLDTLLMRRTSE